LEPVWRSSTSTSSASRWFSASDSVGTNDVVPPTSHTHAAHAAGVKALTDPQHGLARSFADLHCHTNASFDSLSKPEAAVRAAASRGLTHLAITDHDRIDGALTARDAAPEGLTVIIGQEVRTTTGDLIALYLEKPIPVGKSMAEATSLIHEQGGLAGLAHPFDRYRQGAGRAGWENELEQVTPLLDFVEIWNARLFLGDGNQQAAEFDKKFALAGVAVSDAHTTMEIGVAYTILDGHIETSEQLRAALPDARLVTGKGSRLVRLAMPVNKIVQRIRGNRRVVAA
jgi:predicted metal-dependent phosphoesterase TrpH